MKIDFANLQMQYQKYKKEIDDRIGKVLNSSKYIMGPEIGELEETLSSFTGAEYCISCGSGTDALILALKGIDIKPGDEIITTPFTFIATAEIISLLGAIPVFVDIEEGTYNIDVTLIEEKITKRTKAIIPVSLYGQPSDMDEINRLAKEYDLKVIEDAAQSFGATYKGKRSCNLSDVGCTSFFPAKPFGCYGDGGAVFTSDDELADKIKSIRVHGQTKRYFHRYIGFNARMDTVQAAVLLAKFPHYKEEIGLRQKVAEKYNFLFKEKGADLILPKVKPGRTSVWAQYSVRIKKREYLREKLKKSGIPTAVHYPKPLHLQEAFKYLGYKEGEFPVSEKVSKEIMSLPMNPFLTDSEIEYIVNNFN